MSPPVLEELAGPLRPLSLLESARVLGGFRWVELEAFRSLGHLAGEPAPELAVWAAASSMAHAWRAQQLEVLLPVSIGLPGRDECTQPPSEAVAEWVARFGAQVGSGRGEEVGCGDGFYGLLAAAYELRAANAHPSADGQIVRTLGRLAADVRAAAGRYRPKEPADAGET